MPGNNRAVDLSQPKKMSEMESWRPSKVDDKYDATFALWHQAGAGITRAGILQMSRTVSEVIFFHRMNDHSSSSRFPLPAPRSLVAVDLFKREYHRRRHFHGGKEKEGAEGRKRD